MVLNFLRKCGWSLGLLGMGGIASLPAQDISSCEIDLSVLKTEVVTDFAAANPGKVYYLDPLYLQSAHPADAFGSVGAYYEYLRRAPEKALHQDTLAAATIARMHREGDLYENGLLRQAMPFFQVNAAFQGDFRPLQEKPELLLPDGLVPFEVGVHLESPFVLQERSDTYAVFECQGRQVVVYATTAQLAELFHSEEALKLLERKTTYARSLLGLEVRLTYSRDGGHRFIELELADCRVTSQYVIFSYWAGDAGFLYIDGTSRFHLLEQACALAFASASVGMRPGLSEPANELLNEIVGQKNPAKLMQENPVLMQMLMGQFELAEDSYAGITWYLHKEMTPGQTSKTSFLRANLNSNGILYLQSSHFSPAGMGHTTVEVSLGEDKVSTAVVLPADSRNLRVKSEAGIEEQIHFTRNDDREVIPFIAHHAEEPLLLTFRNETGEEESLPIPEAHRRAIRDTYVLYLLIRKE